MFKEYKVGDALTLAGRKYGVSIDSESRFYLSTGDGHNYFVFTYLNVNKSDYVRGVLGYCNTGAFPVCNNIEDLNKLIRKLQEDCLIQEAKERYPKGTKFTPAHTPLLRDQYCISHGEFWVRGGDVVATLKNGAKSTYTKDSIDSPSEDGNTDINRNVFYEGIWAEVYNSGDHTPNYVKITNNGKAYTTHTSAKEYGCSNYDYGVNPENGWVCKVLNEVLVNDEAERKSYILEHDGKHYIVGKSGCVPCDDKLDKQSRFHELEIGDWCSFNWDYAGRRNTVIAKLSGISTDTISTSWSNHTWRVESFHNYAAYQHTEISNVRKLSLEDVQRYLPDDHPDKITNIEPKQPFDDSPKTSHDYIGRYIRFLVADAQCSGVRIGDICEVVDTDGGETIIFKRYDGVAMRANCSRLGDNFILMPKDYTPAFDSGLATGIWPSSEAVIEEILDEWWDGETPEIEQNDKYYLDLTTKSALDTDFKYFTNI